MIVFNVSELVLAQIKIVINIITFLIYSIEKMSV